MPPRGTSNGGEVEDRRGVDQLLQLRLRVSVPVLRGPDEGLVRSARRVSHRRGKVRKGRPGRAERGRRVEVARALLEGEMGRGRLLRREGEARTAERARD